MQRDRLAAFFEVDQSFFLSGGAALAARTNGTAADPDTAPGPAAPWCYQMFHAERSGSSRP